MNAIVYRGINDIRLEAVPIPQIGPGELLVKVAVCGVCPTDIKKIQFGTVPPPRIFGHETAGTIVQVGRRSPSAPSQVGQRSPSAPSQVGRRSPLDGPNLGGGGSAPTYEPDFWKPGMRVALHHHVPCMSCHYCRHRAFAQCPQYKKTGITAGFEPSGGGYAEFVRVMDFCIPGVVAIPDGNSFEEAAMLEPVNTVLKAVNKLDLKPGDTVLVVGQGPIGLLFNKLLSIRGVEVMGADFLEDRRQKGVEFGARSVLDDLTSCRVELRDLTKGLGFDAAVVTVPSDAAVTESVKVVRGAGKVMLFGHTRRGVASAVDFSTVCVDEIDFVGSYSSDWTLQQEVAGLVFSGVVPAGRLVTHRFELAKTAEAIGMASKPHPGALKIMVCQDGV